MRSLVATLAVCAIPLLGCAVESSPDEEAYGEARSAITVAQVVDGDCSATLQLEGLDLQIIEQANCIEPGARGWN